MAAPSRPKIILDAAVHFGAVFSVLFSHHTTRFLSAALDQTVRIWTYIRGNWCSVVLRMNELLPGSDACQADPILFACSLAFSADDALVVTAVEDHSVKVWDSEKGHLLHVLTRHEQDIRFAVPHPLDPRLLLTGGRDGLVVLWDLRRGTIIMSHVCRDEASDKGLRAAAFIPDGSRFVVGDDEGNLLHFWLGHTDALDGLPEMLFFDTEAEDVRFDERGRPLDARVCSFFGFSI